MTSLNLKPKEIDLVVASLEQALVFWDEKIDKGELPKEFNMKTAESLYEDLSLTYLKFLSFQDKMELESESTEEPLPSNVLRFPEGK